MATVVKFFVKEEKMMELLSIIEKTDAFKELTERLRQPDDIWLSGLHGSAFSFIIAALHSRIESPILIILPEEEIEEIREDLIALEVMEIHVFSQRETREDEEIPSYSGVFDSRISTLVALLETQAEKEPDESGNYNARIIIASPQALSEKLPPPALLKKQIKKIKPGDKIDREEFLHYLTVCGYTRNNEVVLKGNFSVRGGIIDIYTPMSVNPVRIELSGNEIASIREFDPQSQISIIQINEAVIMPTKEFSINHAASTLFDYLPAENLIFIREPLQIEPDAAKLFKSKAYGRKIIHCSPSTAETPCKLIDFSTQLLQITPFSDISGKENRVSALIEEIKRLRHLKFTLIIMAEYEGQAERMAELLKEYDLYANLAAKKNAIAKGNILITVLNISRGWIDVHNQLGIIVLKEVFTISKVRRHPGIAMSWKNSERKLKPEPGRESLVPVAVQGLAPGDYVVHINYGIGIFRGVKTIRVEKNLQDSFLIEYADSDKLYIPLDQIKLLQKYIGRIDPPPPLNRLGTTQWQSTRKRVKKSIEEYARELINLYAWRKSVKGHVFSTDTHWQQEFELGFPYEETADQLRTTAEVKEDMERPVPMDRLLCGDVGYGKTEVAMRAAFKAVMDGKQVAVLVPTTILADQHFQTFTERMAPYPIRIEVLSRFKSEPEQKKIIKDLKEGKIEIVIGTHRLIQKDVQFRDLGILIIDEEQRFGVLQKEHFKNLRKEVGVLTLTATPIPRTLYMSTSGIRDISIIDTPPPERLAIKTFVMEFNPEVIRKTMLREIERKGQVFYVHNRIRTLQTHALQLKNLIPDIRIATAHGQMEEKELEKIMHKFLNKEFDVLVSTDIIGAGLDIANVNTVIITEAQDFGLAQLYQLRGRVGRAGHQAYAYIFYNSRSALSGQSLRRLRAISEFVQLGSGLHVAMRDMEIRGAGNILGKEQHGHVQSVGLELYCRMLEETVSALKGSPVKEETEPVLDLKVNAYIPDEYVPGVEQKTVLYKRMAAIKEIEEINRLNNELKDRYGKIPQPVLNLIKVLEIRVLAKNIGVRSIKINEKSTLRTAGNQAIISLDSGTLKIDIDDPDKSLARIRTCLRQNLVTRGLSR